MPEDLTMMCRKGMRTETSIVAETAQCFSTHHVALLVGYGAHAICPYLAFETCRQWRSSSRSVSSHSSCWHLPQSLTDHVFSQKSWR